MTWYGHLPMKCLCGVHNGFQEVTSLEGTALRHQELGQAAPHGRPHRSNDAWPRHPLHRHLASGIDQITLRNRLLRARPGGELHQAAQGPTRLRSDIVSRPARQPDAFDLAHCGLLAAAHPTRGRTQAFAVGRRRVQYAASTFDHDCRARRRRSRTHPRLVANRMPRRRDVRVARRPLRRGTVSAGARATL